MARPHRKPHVVLRRIEQLALATFLLCGLASLSGYWIWRGVVRGRLIEIEQATPRTAQFQVDINSAQWPELAQLPGIGETMARRIVDERKVRGQYADHQDLERRIKGVGPRTLERIRPYLAPMPDARNIAAGSTSTGGTGS
jgi:competence protein ComEA